MKIKIYYIQTKEKKEKEKRHSIIEVGVIRGGQGHLSPNMKVIDTSTLGFLNAKKFPI